MEKDFAELEMTITGYMQKQFKTVFNLEIEMLQGEYKKLPNGMHYYKITMTEEKSELVKSFMEHCMKDTRVDSKIMGIPLNKN